jgi:hypothetical protein
VESGSSSTTPWVVPGVPSTFKSLPRPSTLSDNIFDELDSSKGTSWQFELHQLRLTNKKLQDEKTTLAEYMNNHRHSLTSQDHEKKQSSLPYYPPSPPEMCANCGSESNEWMAGPTGPDTLCKACATRWTGGESGNFQFLPNSQSPVSELEDS